MTFNNPEYYVVDEIGNCVTAARVALDAAAPGQWPNLNYQYGYITEFNQTMQTWSNNETDAAKKFPCVYLIQPFTIKRGRNVSIYGTVSGLRIFIITSEADVNKKAAARMATNFKPILYPIYRELLNQLDLSVVFPTTGKENIQHDFTDRYYWGENQGKLINDAVDCCEISNLILDIHNKLNC